MQFKHAEKFSEWVDRWTSVSTIVPFGFFEALLAVLNQVLDPEEPLVAYADRAVARFGEDEPIPTDLIVLAASHMVRLRALQSDGGAYQFTWTRAERPQYLTVRAGQAVDPSSRKKTQPEPPSRAAVQLPEALRDGDDGWWELAPRHRDALAFWLQPLQPS